MRQRYRRRAVAREIDRRRREGVRVRCGLGRRSVVVEMLPAAQMPPLLLLAVCGSDRRGLGRRGRAVRRLRRRGRRLIPERRDHALAPLDDRLLHGAGPIAAVQLVVETAGVADGMAVLVSSPERRHGRAAVLARDQQTATVLARTRVSLVRTVRLIAVLAAPRLVRTVSGHRLVHAVVEGRASVASLGTTGPVAIPAAGACSHSLTARTIAVLCTSGRCRRRTLSELSALRGTGAGR